MTRFHARALASALIMCTANGSVASAQTAASSGAGASGPMPVESTVIEYQTLVFSAHRIDQQLVRLPLSPDTRFVIATNADIGAMTQVQAIVGQAKLIVQRVRAVRKNVANLPCYSPVAPRKKPAPPPKRPDRSKFVTLQDFLPGLWPALLTNASGIQTLVQTVASAGAVNQTITPAVGTLNDASLVNLVIAGLPQRQVYVPSVYGANMMTHAFYHSILGTAITKLENERAALYSIADRKILTPQCQYSADKGKTRYNQATLDRIASEAFAASSLVDTFQTSLLGGAVNAPPAPASASAPAAAVGAGNAAAPASSSQPLASAQTGGASAVQQLLYADAMLQQMGASYDNTSVRAAAPYYLVSVHSLESGGNVLTKNNIFSGSRVFFSGASVATFSVFQADGAIVCSGVSYAYRGFIAASDVNAGLVDTQVAGQPQDSNDPIPAAHGFTSNCPNVAAR